jgi:hypothetical protein
MTNHITDPARPPAPFTLEELAEFCWLNLIAYRQWSDWGCKQAMAADVARWDGRAAPPEIVEALLRRFDVVDHESFASGLDITIFRDASRGLNVIALDGTDPSLQCRDELRRDLSEGIALAFGRSVGQVKDYLAFMRRFCPAGARPEGTIVSVGHSLGGYVQQVGGALAAARLDQAIALNAPGLWRFSRDRRRLENRTVDRLLTVSARDFVYPIGRPIGKRLVLPDLRRHSLGALARYLETRAGEGWRLVLDPDPHLEAPTDPS